MLRIIILFDLVILYFSMGKKGIDKSVEIYVVGVYFILFIAVNMDNIIV